MNNQRGMTLVEVMIAVGIASVCIAGIFSAIARFNSQLVKANRSVASRTLLAQQVGQIVSRPDEYPPFSYDGAEGSYVLCFNNQLAQVDYSPATTVKFVKTTDLVNSTGNPVQQCTSAYEVRVRPETNSTGAVRWHVVVTMYDPIYQQMVQKEEDSFANAAGI